MYDIYNSVFAVHDTVC